jgi:hypothetical protein
VEGQKKLESVVVMVSTRDERQLVAKA